MSTLITELGRLRAYVLQIMREVGSVSALAPRLAQQQGEDVVDELDALYDELANAEFDEVDPDPKIVPRLRTLAPRVTAMFGEEEGRAVETVASSLESGDLVGAINALTRVVSSMFDELDPYGTATEFEQLLAKSSEEEAQRRRAAFRVV